MGIFKASSAEKIAHELVPPEITVCPLGELRQFVKAVDSKWSLSPNTLDPNL